MSYILTGDSGTVVFQKQATVTDSDTKYSSKATSNPIERGGNINDHAALDPINFSISGVVVGGRYKETLEAMWRNRDLLSYRGDEAFDNLLIVSLSIKRSTNIAGGFTFSISFQQMDVSSAAFVPSTGPTMSQQDAAATTSRRSAKVKTENGLVTTSSEYASYVSTYDSNDANTGITDARTNPSNKGY